MSIRHLGLMSVLVILGATGCRPSSSYTVLGKDLLEVKDPGGGNLAAAISDASRALAHSVSTQPGVVSIPSFAQSSRYWGAKGSPAVTRCITTFKDKAGRAIRIEAISRPDTPTLVFIECEASGDPMVVLNQITQSLDKAGVGR